jgi:hypothetical protein
VPVPFRSGHEKDIFPVPHSNHFAAFDVGFRQESETKAQVPDKLPCHGFNVRTPGFGHAARPNLPVQLLHHVHADSSGLAGFPCDSGNFQFDLLQARREE